jgi:hypothetical protein
MDLIGKPLNDVLNLEVLLILADRILVLVLGRQHGNWDCNFASVLRINHGRMASSRSLEWCTLLAGKIHDLASPAISHDCEALDVRVLALDSFEDLWDAREGLRRGSRALEEGTELLAFLFVVRWVPANVSWIALEEVRDEDVVGLLMITRCKYVGTLKCLRVESEDIVDDQYAMFGIGRASLV